MPLHSSLATKRDSISKKEKLIKIIIIKLPKVKDKERILKAAKERNNIKWSSNPSGSRFLNGNLPGEERVARHI